MDTQKDSTLSNSADTGRSGRTAGKLFPIICVLLILFLAADVIISTKALNR